jgi:hypothetical protein
MKQIILRIFFILFAVLLFAGVLFGLSMCAALIWGLVGVDRGMALAITGLIGALVGFIGTVVIGFNLE